MRLEKAVAISLALHLLASGAVAISQGIKRNDPAAAPPAVFAELVPPPDMTHRAPERLAEERAGAAGKQAEPTAETGAPTPEAFIPAGAPDAPPADPATAAAAAAPPEPAAPLPAAAFAESSPGATADNAALHAMPDPAMIERVRMHHLAMASTESFYRFVPAELNRVVNEALANGAFMSQGDALIHMDVTPSGQVGDAHVQANSQALFHRLERIDWRAALPSRPLAACNAIHLRISVEGNDIRVDVELL